MPAISPSALAQQQSLRAWFAWCHGLLPRGNLSNVVPSTFGWLKVWRRMDCDCHMRTASEWGLQNRLLRRRLIALKALALCGVCPSSPCFYVQGSRPACLSMRYVGYITSGYWDLSVHRWTRPCPGVFQDWYTTHLAAWQSVSRVRRCFTIFICLARWDWQPILYALHNSSANLLAPSSSARMGRKVAKPAPGPVLEFRQHRRLFGLNLHSHAHCPISHCLHLC